LGTKLNKVFIISQTL